MANTPQSTAWYTASVNAHYDNIAGVSYDSVWEGSQRSRYEQALATAADDLARTVASVADGVDAPLVIFNPTSWRRSEVVELTGDLLDAPDLPAPAQQLGSGHGAIWAPDVPPVGYTALAGTVAVTIGHPSSATQTGKRVTLNNGLMSVTIDGYHSYLARRYTHSRSDPRQVPFHGP